MISGFCFENRATFERTFYSFFDSYENNRGYFGCVEWGLHGWNKELFIIYSNFCFVEIRKLLVEGVKIIFILFEKSIVVYVSNFFLNKRHVLQKILIWYFCVIDAINDVSEFYVNEVVRVLMMVKKCCAKAIFGFQVTNVVEPRETTHKRTDP